jgi:nicotinate dehydrogenase subunit A
MSLVITVNGAKHTVQADPTTPLLYVLRNELLLHGPRFGCGLSECGACTVIFTDSSGTTTIRSCVTPVVGVSTGEVTTLEGLIHDGKPSAVQQAFIDESAAQCGYCTNGMMMASTIFLRTNPNPTEAQIKKALEPWLCRCGTHYRIIRAVQRAAAVLRAG